MFQRKQVFGLLHYLKHNKECILIGHQFTIHTIKPLIHIFQCCKPNFVLQGRAVQTALSLEEGLKQVVHLDFIDQVHPEYHDKLVHLSGNLQTDKVSLGVVFDFSDQCGYFGFYSIKWFG